MCGRGGRRYDSAINHAPEGAATFGSELRGFIGTLSGVMIQCVPDNHVTSRHVTAQHKNDFILLFGAAHGRRYEPYAHRLLHDQLTGTVRASDKGGDRFEAPDIAEEVDYIERGTEEEKQRYKNKSYYSNDKRAKRARSRKKMIVVEVDEETRRAFGNAQGSYELAFSVVP